MEIRAIGAAKAELAASAMLAKAGVPQSLLEEIEGEIDQRIDTLFEKRLSNLAQIVTKAKDALPPGQVPDVEPDLAWTSSFSEAAQDVSDEEMQEMWARVLAGEVARPGTTSLRTMNVLRNLDQAHGPEVQAVVLHRCVHNNSGRGVGPSSGVARSRPSSGVARR